MASAERLLQLNPGDQFLNAAKNTTEKEFTEKEVRSAEWDAICNSVCWHQIDGRMNKSFFLGVQQAKNNPPIQQLIDEDDTEFNTNAEMAEFATGYYRNLFSRQGESEACTQAREAVWRTTLKLVTR